MSRMNHLTINASSIIHKLKLSLIYSAESSLYEWYNTARISADDSLGRNGGCFCIESLKYLYKQQSKL